MFFPELLYIQNVRVDDGTRENSVSKSILSVENVSVFDGEVVKDSSSAHAEISSAIRGMIYMIVFLSIL